MKRPDFTAWLALFSAASAYLVLDARVLAAAENRLTTAAPAQQVKVCWSDIGFKKVTTASPLCKYATVDDAIRAALAKYPESRTLNNLKLKTNEHTMYPTLGCDTQKRVTLIGDTGVSLDVQTGTLLNDSSTGFSVNYDSRGVVLNDFFRRCTALVKNGKVAVGTTCLAGTRGKTVQQVTSHSGLGFDLSQACCSQPGCKQKLDHDRQAAIAHLQQNFNRSIKDLRNAHRSRAQQGRTTECWAFWQSPRPIWRSACVFRQLDALYL